MTALSCQVIRTYLHAIQIIGKFYRCRKFLGSSSLIVDILILCIPGQVISVLVKSLITFDVLDILKIRHIA